MSTSGVGDALSPAAPSLDQQEPHSQGRAPRWQTLWSAHSTPGASQGRDQRGVPRLPKVLASVYPSTGAPLEFIVAERSRAARAIIGDPGRLDRSKQKEDMNQPFMVKQATAEGYLLTENSAQLTDDGQNTEPMRASDEQLLPPSLPSLLLPVLHTVLAGGAPESPGPASPVPLGS